MWYLEASGEWGGKEFRSLDSMHGFCHLQKLAAPGFPREGTLKAPCERSITFQALGHSDFPRIKLLLEERGKKMPLAQSAHLIRDVCKEKSGFFFPCVPESTGMWKNHHDQPTHLSPPPRLLHTCSHEWTVDSFHSQTKLGTVAE